MPAPDFGVYERGRIAMGSGDLFDVTDVSLQVSNNAAPIHTLRQENAGVRRGPTEVRLSFNAVVSKEGPERDYLFDLFSGRLKDVRIKIPGETLSIHGVVAQRTLEIPLDDAVRYGVQIVGKIDQFRAVN